MKRSRYILITGCSSGIGYESAHILKNSGYTVNATARKDDDVKRLQEEGFIVLQFDLDDSSSIDNVVEQVKKITNSRLYALFNNAAYGQPGAVEDLSRDVLKAQFETNLFGTHELTVKILPMMIEAGEGRVIQNSSVLGFTAMRYRGAYNASKFALEGLSDTLRLELKGSDIYVSSINTGPVRSDFRKNATNMFKKNIKIENSFFKKEYKEQLLEAKDKNKAKFTKNSDVVIANVVHALESKVPKPKYYNTSATYILGFFKRILPTYMMDKVLFSIWNGV